MSCLEFIIKNYYGAIFGNKRNRRKEKKNIYHELK